MQFLGIHVLSFLAGVVVGFLLRGGFFRGLMRGSGGYGMAGG